VPVAWLGDVCTPATQHAFDGWFKLEARIDKPDKSAQGEVHLRFTFAGASATDEEQAAAAADTLARKNDAGVAVWRDQGQGGGRRGALTQSSDAREALARELAQFQREAAQYGSREGTLSLCVVSAKDLLAKDEGGVSDPFCIVTLLDSTVQRRGVEMKTHTIEKTMAPTWNKDFAIPLDRDCTHIRFEVRDKDETKTQFLGLATVPIGSIAGADRRRAGDHDAAAGDARRPPGEAGAGRAARAHGVPRRRAGGRREEGAVDGRRGQVSGAGRRRTPRRGERAAELAAATASSSRAR
jgi:hypothetical protein